MTANRVQIYKNKTTEPDKIQGFCAYNWVKLNLNQLREMSKIGIMTSDWKNVPIFEEYLSLLKEGVPKERIRQYLSKKYSVSESTLKRIQSRFSAWVKP